MMNCVTSRFLVKQQLVRHICCTVNRPGPIQNVAIIGSGSMGSGIAQVAAQSGNSVQVVDLNEKILERSRNTIQVSLQRIAQKKFENNSKAGESYVTEILNRINFGTNIEPAVKDSDLVVECIIENLKLKQDLFQKLDKICPEKTILASNTSSCSITQLSQEAQRSDRVVGLHFFNPAPVMKLVEIIRIPQTSDETYNQALTWTKSVGKVPVTCKDTPGFIVNRLLISILSGAVRILERGDATAEDIDTAMKLGCGHPLGPLELIDVVGVDIHAAVVEMMHKHLPDNNEFDEIPLLKQMVKENKLGRKTGEGFYKYGKK